MKSRAERESKGELFRFRNNCKRYLIRRVLKIWKIHFNDSKESRKLLFPLATSGWNLVNLVNEKMNSKIPSNVNCECYWNLRNLPQAGMKRSVQHAKEWQKWWRTFFLRPTVRNCRIISSLTSFQLFSEHFQYKPVNAC